MKKTKSEPCPCGIHNCKGGAPKHDQKLRARVKALEARNRVLNNHVVTLAVAKKPTLDRCAQVEAQVLQFNQALEQWKRRASLIDVDLSQRYILIQELTLKLATLIGNEQAEAFVRSAVPAPFIRTLGPLEPIFKAMRANEERGQAARKETELPLPDGFFPELTDYRRDRLLAEMRSKKR